MTKRWMSLFNCVVSRQVCTSLRQPKWVDNIYRAQDCPRGLQNHRTDETFFDCANVENRVKLRKISRANKYCVSLKYDRIGETPRYFPNEIFPVHISAVLLILISFY